MRRVIAAAICVAALAVAGCGGGGRGADRPATASVPARSDHEYSGVGSKIIGTLALPHGADARWTSTGGLFMLIAINAPASAQLIVSKAASGSEYVPGGSYVLKVGTSPGAKWTLRLRER